MKILTKYGEVDSPADIIKTRNLPGDKISPTGIIMQKTCDRMSWFKYLAEVIAPVTPKQQEAFDWGTAMHLTYEDFIRGVIDDIEDDFYKPAIPYLMDIRETLESHAQLTNHLPDEYVERKVSVANDILRVEGLADVIVPPGGKVFGVIDHKSTSHPRWCKTDLDAIKDPQTLVYGMAAFQMKEFEGLHKIPVVYHYTQKPKKSLPPRSWPVKIEMNRAESQQRWDRYIVPSLERFRELEQIEHWEQIPLPKDTSICHKHFGAPCAFKPICYGGASNKGRFAGAGSVAVKATRNEVASMSWKDRQKAATQKTTTAAPAAVTPTPPTPKPTPPPAKQADGLTLEECQALYLDGKRGGDGIDMGSLDQMVKLKFIRWMSAQSSGPINSPEARPNHEPDAILDGDGNEISEIQAAGLPTVLERVLLGLGCKSFQDVAERTSTAALLKTTGIGPKKVKDLAAMMLHQGVTLPEEGGQAIEGDASLKVSLTTDEPSFAKKPAPIEIVGQGEVDVVETNLTRTNAPILDVPEAWEEISLDPEAWEEISLDPDPKPTLPAPTPTGFMLLIHATIASHKMPTATNIVTEQHFIDYAQDMNEGAHPAFAPYGGDKALIMSGTQEVMQSGQLAGATVMLMGGPYSEMIATVLTPHADMVIRGAR